MTETTTEFEASKRTPWQTIAEFRFLLILYFVFVPLAIWELSQPEKVDLVLATEGNYTDVLAELLPNRVETYLAKARQAGECLVRAQDNEEVPILCWRFKGQDIKQLIREDFERAIELAAKDSDSEDLYMEYLLFLKLIKAEQSEIDAAYDLWRTKYPHSQKRDPRAYPQE